MPCVRVCAVGGEKPTISAVFMTYAGLGPGVTVRDLCCRHDMAKNRIDERSVLSGVSGLLLLFSWRCITVNCSNVAVTQSYMQPVKVMSTASRPLVFNSALSLMIFFIT